MTKNDGTYKSFHTMMEPCAGPHKDNRLACRKEEEKIHRKVLVTVCSNKKKGIK